MPGPLANVKHLLRGIMGTWRDVFLLNTRSREKLVNLSSHTTRAELKFATSSYEVGTVRRVDGNGKEPNATRSAYVLTYLLGHIPRASSWLLFGWPRRSDPPGSGSCCSHFQNTPAAASHSGGRRASHVYFNPLPLFMVHSIYISHAMLE